MSKENQTEETNEKVVTRYDRRKEKRKIEEEKERKSWQRFKVVCLIIAAVVAVAVIFSIGTGAYNRYSALKGTFAKVGDHKITGVEYDYYFNNSVNSYVAMYGSYASLMGLDTTKALDEQQYTDNMTWKDYFDQTAMNQIAQTKALVDEAEKNGFTYDDTEELAAFDESIKTQAEASSATEAEYYIYSYGEYATKDRIRPFIKENLLASAYYDKLIGDNQPSSEEIESYYQEHRNEYDKLTFRLFYFAADLEEDASDEEIAAAMEKQKALADEMAARRADGENFEDLCVKYAGEDQKDTYGGETDGSLKEDISYYSVPSVAMDWLFDDARKEGELQVFEDETAHRCYVIEFIKKTNDEQATAQSIADSLSSEVVNAYVAKLAENYEVTDVKGELKYLTVPEETAETEAAETEAAETEAAETETAAE